MQSRRAEGVARRTFTNGPMMIGSCGFDEAGGQQSFRGRSLSEIQLRLYTHGVPWE